MTAFLPPNLLALFAPREPLKYLPPAAKLLVEVERPPLSGIAQFINNFETTPAPPKVPVELREQRIERKRKERQELQAYRIEQGIALWNPSENNHATDDPYKTLFVSNINYETSESKLRKEFEQFGSVRKVHMITDSKTGKPRGYAFIEFDRERDMHSAYKRTDGMKIDGRRLIVDVERGRTVKGWLPRRFGGGVGTSRRARSPGQGDRRGDERERSRDRGERSRDRDRDSRRDESSRDRDRDSGRRDRRSDRDSDRRGDRSVKREHADDESRSSHRDRDSKRSRRDEGNGERDRSAAYVKREPTGEEE